MLIACASDAHGAKSNIASLVNVLPRIDAFCFLGDCDRDADLLSDLLTRKQPDALFLSVAGNNDSFSPYPKTIERPFCDTRTIITHGHLFSVKWSTHRLCAYAKTRDCGLALFGHTHVELDAEENGVRLVNPGALKNGRYALIELSEGIEIQLARL